MNLGGVRSDADPVLNCCGEVRAGLSLRDQIELFCQFVVHTIVVQAK